ncbi:MAG: galactokinase [Lachnospiraceae bacterium]|nr:galactokinase [Lachnospiraceae bacterium]
MITANMKELFKSGAKDELLMDIYLDEAKLAYQRDRYVSAIEEFEKLYGEAEVSIYSAPGRSEIGGNHTDHQNGEVLAASVNLDAIAIVETTDNGVVTVVSDDYPMIKVDVNDLEKKDEEEGTTLSLIKGVLAGIKDRDGKVGGFNAYITSDVLIGAGLSSSAAFETIIGTITSGLYNDMEISAVDIAIIGQYAENVYFGKPCGLMDQTASSVGNLVHIDFADKKNPVIEGVSCDLGKYGYSLCITDTKGSHADLTPDYAAVPGEMKAAAAVLGKEVLLGVTMEDLLEKSAEIRAAAGDRALLRAIHLVNENVRVQQEVAALKAEDFEGFLKVVKASGDSSYKFLQNVYTNHDVQHQNVSVALAISESVLGTNGVCRVHGGGFAGTIQAFVKNEAVAEYKATMDKVFGEGSCQVLMIRKYGGMKVL